jgi:hypothetical protein
MIFISESGLVDARRAAEWGDWYIGHLEAMLRVPGITSAQRLLATDDGPPPSLALYTVASPAAFESEVYLRTRGMGPWQALIEPRHHHRNLFDGLDAAPEVPPGGILLVADRAVPEPDGQGLIWLRAVGLDRSTRCRGVAVLPDTAAARRCALSVGGEVALYRPVTPRLIGRPE